MKTLIGLLMLLTFCGKSNAQVDAPEFSKIATIKVADPSESATGYSWKVDEAPADANVHQVADFAISSVFLESGGWHFLADCTNFIATIPCKPIPAGEHEVQWKGRTLYKWNAMYPDGSETRGQVYGPASVAVTFQQGGKKKKVTYKLESYERCTSEDKAVRICTFYDLALR
jgi:hypothetical protein